LVFAAQEYQFDTLRGEWQGSNLPNWHTSINHHMVVDPLP